MRLIVGITGASGVIYGIRLLEVLKGLGVETHLILTQGGRMTVPVETGLTAKDVEALAHTVHSNRNLGATPSSGSWKHDGMIVAPCSIKSLSGIVHSYADNLLVRAADVTLKEGRKLVLMPRETPLHAGHCKLMHEAALIGATLVPPMPAFYTRPQTVDDIVNHTVGRVLDLFGLDAGLVKRWPGVGADD